MMMTGGETVGKGLTADMDMRRMRYPVVHRVGRILAGIDPPQDESGPEDLLVHLRKCEQQKASAAPTNGATTSRGVLPFLEDMQSVRFSVAHLNLYADAPSHATNTAMP